MSTLRRWTTLAVRSLAALTLVAAPAAAQPTDAFGYGLTLGRWQGDGCATRTSAWGTPVTACAEVDLTLRYELDPFGVVDYYWDLSLYSEGIEPFFSVADLYGGVTHWESFFDLWHGPGDYQLRAYRVVQQAQASGLMPWDIERDWQVPEADVTTWFQVHPPQPFPPNYDPSSDYDIVVLGVPVALTAVPEPATIALTAGGLLALAGVARRRRA
jgi:hypothetical protein